MKKIIAIILIWIFMGWFNWGAYMGMFLGEIKYSEPRSHYGIVLFLSTIPAPLTFAISPFITNLYQYGFRWE